MADSPQDRQIGLDFKRYVLRGCPPPGKKLKVPKDRMTPRVKKYLEGAAALCGGVSAIEVEDSRIRVRSGLEDDGEGRLAGLAFCNLVKGSDVADFTPGHELVDGQGEAIRVCGARSLP